VDTKECGGKWKVTVDKVGEKQERKDETQVVGRKGKVVKEKKSVG